MVGKNGEGVVWIAPAVPAAFPSRFRCSRRAPAPFPPFLPRARPIPAAFPIRSCRFRRVPAPFQPFPPCSRS